MPKKPKPLDPALSPTTPPSVKPLWNRPWVVIPAAITGFATALAGVTTILTNARSLPSEWQKTAHQFSSWYHDDNAWTGKWSNNPESYLDEADMNLSKEKVEVELWVKNGLVDGTIATLGVCNTLPFTHFVLLRGEVSGSNLARVVAWDVVQGRKTDFANLRLERDGSIMTVSLQKGDATLFPASARIAHAPKEHVGATDKLEFCEWKVESTTGRIRKSISELHTTRPTAAK